MPSKHLSRARPATAIEDWFEVGKGAIEPTRELTEIFRRAFAKINDQNMSAAKAYLDFCLHGLNLLGEVRDPGQLLEQQAKLAEEISEKFFADTSAYFDLTAATQAEIFGWVEKTTATAAEQVESTAGQAEQAVSKAA